MFDAIRALNSAIIAILLALVYLALFGIARLFVRKQPGGWHVAENPAPDSFSSPY